MAQHAQTEPDMVTLKAKGIDLCFDPQIGMIAQFSVSDGRQKIAPLHRAPWVGSDETMPADAAPHLAKLGGDFFCAPFAGCAEGSPLHGWTANSEWQVVSCHTARLEARLARAVFGGAVTKTLTLRDGHPFVYQSHVFSGCTGEVSMANHANLSLPDGGLIATSPKAAWMTLPEPLEPDPTRGRSSLIYPEMHSDMQSFPGKDGPVDLSTYPWLPSHEEFVAGIEAAGHTLGWTAVTRPVQGDVFLSLRCASVLPMTMFWHSNGGRDYAPWSSRHFGCLGIEEGAAVDMLGDDRDVPLSAPGQVALNPDQPTRIAHAIGAIPWPSGSRLRDVDLAGNALRIAGTCGAQVSIPFDATHLFAMPD